MNLSQLYYFRKLAEVKHYTHAAEELFISPATVKTHLARVMAKTDAHDRAQLVVFAYETGLVTPAP